MKKELIKTDNYLLVVDQSEIKDEEWFYNPNFNKIGINYNSYGCKKIIVHLPLNDSPILEGVPLLPPLEVEDDVEMMAEEEYPIIPYTSPNINWDRANKQEGFESGYNKAREKYKFTEEDMRFMIMKSFLLGVDRGQYSKELEDKLITSFSQPKTPTEFEFEMESMTIDEIREQGKGFLHASTFKIKTTNSQGQQVACGKYIY